MTNSVAQASSLHEHAHQPVLIRDDIMQEDRFSARRPEGADFVGNTLFVGVMLLSLAAIGLFVALVVAGSASAGDGRPLPSATAENVGALLSPEPPPHHELLGRLAQLEQRTTALEAERRRQPTANPVVTAGNKDAWARDLWRDIAENGN